MTILSFFLIGVTGSFPRSREVGVVGLVSFFLSVCLSLVVVWLVAWEAVLELPWLSGGVRMKGGGTVRTETLRGERGKKEEEDEDDEEYEKEAGRWKQGR